MIRSSQMLAAILLFALVQGSLAQGGTPSRARDLGVAPGIFSPGSHNAITDVPGVKVGHTTLIKGENIRTGITAILPHDGNVYFERVPAAIFVGNGFGKLVGSTQVDELGEIETPVILTCTLCVWKAADALVEWMLEQPGMSEVSSINPLVGETNDGWLNAIRSRPIDAKAVRTALTSAGSGPVQEGSVGAGTGTVAFGWKGGIGTSSRVLPKTFGGWVVGVLVQTNFGGVLQILGAPVGKELGKHKFKQEVEPGAGEGSIMIVVATDAPLLDRNLLRLASRAMLGVGRTGSSASNGSGDYVIAFSTAESVRRRVGPRGVLDGSGSSAAELANEEMSGLFQAVIEATEEAVYNSLFAAATITSQGRTVERLPLDRVQAILEKYGVGGR